MPPFGKCVNPLNMTAPANIIILHGYAEGPTKVWIPWLHHELEKRQLRVWAPALPDPIRPSFKRWLGVIKEAAATWGPETIVVGHSIGGALALRALETHVRRPVRGTVLVSAPFDSIISAQAMMDFFDQPIDWAGLRRKAGRVTVIHAKNDPLIPRDHALRYIEALGAKLRLMPAGGHFIGRTAPVILREIETMMRD